MPSATAMAEIGNKNMHMSLMAEFDTGAGLKENMTRIELVQTHEDNVEIRIRHEHVADLDRDQLIYLGTMIDKMVGHMTKPDDPETK